MKKIWMAAMLAGAGLSGTVVTPVNEQVVFALQNPESMQQQAEKLAEEMAKGNFSNIYKKFSAQMLAALSAEKLKQTWDATVTALGEYQEIYDCQESKSGTMTTEKVILRYENGGLAVLITFGASGTVDGLFMNFYTIPAEAEVTDQYEEQSIQIPITVNQKAYKLDGKLTMPSGSDQEAVPLVILVQGSGQSDMDESIGENKPFQDIARGLAERGIASIRYNKRYYQYPELAEAEITIEDEVLDDVSSAIAFGQKQEGIAADRLFIIGHSLGGMLAPKIAADHKAVTGMISMAGSPRTLQEIVYSQNCFALEKSSDQSEKEKKSILKEVADAVSEIDALTESDSGTYLNIPASYWYSLNQIHQGELAQKLEIPMLFLQGDADFQVTEAEDFDQWKALLEENEQAEFKLYDGLNHLFMKSNGAQDETEYEKASSVDAQVITDMADWILSDGEAD